MVILWVVIVISSVFFGMISGNAGSILVGIANASKNSVAFCISLCGIFAVWSGLMEAAQQAGLLSKASKLLKPVIKLLFKGASTPQAREAITMNLTANILGMGNAATPAGQKAIRELAACSDKKGSVTPDMVMLLIINNSALTLVPTTVLTLRAAAGSADPGVIIPFALISSAISTVIAIVLGLIFR